LPGAPLPPFPPLPPFLQTVLHKQTHGSPPFSSSSSPLPLPLPWCCVELPLRLSLDDEFLLRLSSDVLLDDELLLEEELDELDEDELCFSSYTLRSSLRFFSHSGFSLEPSFLNRQILICIFDPSTPMATANSAEHPLIFVGAFKI